MKKISKICACLLVLLLVCSLVLPADARGYVTYDSNADEFIFRPGTVQSPTSLFENFQNVMPGDTLTEQIFIRNDVSRNKKIRVYLRSLGAQEGTDEFLSMMNLKVKQKNESILFDAPADETAQLTDWVYLGTVYSGGQITLDVTLEVPITMGDEFQNQIGYIDWQFKIEELPVDPSDPEPPKTGDSSNVLLYGGLMAVSLIAIVFLLFLARRRKKEEETQQ